MLDKNGTRQLCYVAKVSEVKPIQGKDRVECAIVGGWACMVPKDSFKVGDLGVYFEIDSKVDYNKPEFAFTAKYHGKIKTQKFAIKDENGNKVGQFFSQGLLMPFEDLNRVAVDYKEGDFLTKELGVTYAEAEDNKRKAKSDPNAKYKSMISRHPKLAKSKFGRWAMKHMFMKKLLYFFLGRKSDKKREWPSHIAAKTDVERIQNMVYILNDKKPFVATEKVDGSSCSVMAERTKTGKINVFVCSRNVVFKDENQECYYDKNIYFEAYEKYNLKDKIIAMMKELNVPNLALQMEVYGDGVQKRDYSLKDERKIAIFHILSNTVKYPMDKVVELCDKYDLPHVPVLDYNYILPDTLDELQQYVEGEMSKIDGKEKEGIVFYDKETGQQYFKYVSPNFLMKYHG